MLFQVLSIDGLGKLSFELSLIKVQRREKALSELMKMKMKMKVLWIRYQNGCDENFPYFIDILP